MEVVGEDEFVLVLSFSKGVVVVLAEALLVQKESDGVFEAEVEVEVQVELEGVEAATFGL